MRLGHLVLVSSIAISLAIPAAAVTRKRLTPTTSAKTSSSKATSHRVTATRTGGKKGGKRASKAIKGQRGIDDARAIQIQAALIKAGYLSGQPSGHWDAQSQSAMQKLQGDNGWQTKLVPDSRALIKLGLGPSSESIASADAPPEPATFASSGQ